MADTFSNRDARRRKILASVAVLPWLLVAWAVSMPLRWELQRTYPRWLEGFSALEGVEGSLPWLTTAVALPAVGIGRPSVVGFLSIFAFWGILWLWPAIALVRIWRSGDADRPADDLVRGFIAHAGAVVLLMVVLGFGLWLPFAVL
jgi:hypothetical protein